MYCSQIATSAKILSLGVLLALTLAGCSSLPYSPKTEAAVAGAAVGAAATSLIGSGEGTLLGALAGAGAGYVLAAETDWFTGGEDPPDPPGHHHHSSSSHSPASFFNHLAWTRVHPATIASVYTDDDADLNGDGMVTIDEVVAMAHSELDQGQVMARLEATNQVFFFNAGKRQRLLTAGVAPDVVAKLQALSRARPPAAAMR